MINNNYFSVTTNVHNHLPSIVYNPLLNSLIYLKEKQERIVPSVNQLSTLFYRTLSSNNVNEPYEIISCQHKFLLLTLTRINCSAFLINIEVSKNLLDSLRLFRLRIQAYLLYAGHCLSRLHHQVNHHK